MQSFRLTCFSRWLVALALALEIPVRAQTSAPPATVTFSNTRPLVIPRRPSIILIIADGLGYGDLSCYGQAKFQTPNIDKLASEGVRFTNYTAEISSVVTEAALMYGKGRPTGIRRRKPKSTWPSCCETRDIIRR